MSNERFTTEWWRELFKRGKPLGYGGVELRDEDKYYWILRQKKLATELAKAVVEKFGEEGAKLVTEVRERNTQERWEFLMNCLNIKPADPASIAAVMATGDANLGSEVEINVSPDGETAEAILRRCTLFELGLATKEICKSRAVSAIESKTFMKALGPAAENVEIAESEIDPPRHCRIVFRRKE